MSKMTVPEAAKVWAESKREIDRLRPQLDVAAETLKVHFRKTGKTKYRNRIVFAVTTRLQLDSSKVKAELGDRLPEFQRRVEIEQLSLLKD